MVSATSSSRSHHRTKVSNMRSLLTSNRSSLVLKSCALRAVATPVEAQARTHETTVTFILCTNFRPLGFGIPITEKAANRLSFSRAQEFAPALLSDSTKAPATAPMTDWAKYCFRCTAAHTCEQPTSPLLLSYSRTFIWISPGPARDLRALSPARHGRCCETLSWYNLASCDGHGIIINNRIICHYRVHNSGGDSEASAPLGRRGLHYC